MARFNKNKQVNPIAHKGSNMQYRTFGGRVVEAKLQGSDVMFAFSNFVDDILSDTKFVKGSYGPQDTLADTYYGRAYCNVEAGEVFDEEVGKKIATQRCTSLFRQDFDEKLVQFLEELHRIEVKIFNRLRKKGKIDLYFKAKGVDEIYDSSFRMPGQPDFFSLLGKTAQKISNHED